MGTLLEEVYSRSLGPGHDIAAVWDTHVLQLHFLFERPGEQTCSKSWFCRCISMWVQFCSRLELLFQLMGGSVGILLGILTSVTSVPQASYCGSTLQLIVHQDVHTVSYGLI